MKTLKHISLFALLVMFATSCYVEVIQEDDYVVVEPEPTSAFNLNQYLQFYELWYLDVEQTTGNSHVPFLDVAFTLSFSQGNVLANNNLVGIGSRGDGFGIQVGYYNTIGDVLEINHDIDGVQHFEVVNVNANHMILKDLSTGTGYVFYGYQRHSFDYDLLFYNNIHSFLQEYTLWEKIATSVEGRLNHFDEENFVQFLPFGQGDNFNSSIDAPGTSPNNVVWDYQGHYEVTDIKNNDYLKGLFLDYEPMGSEYFEMSIPNDATISFYHPLSATTYTFRGRGYIQYKNQDSNSNQRLTKAQFKKLSKDSK